MISVGHASKANNKMSRKQGLELLFSGCFACSSKQTKKVSQACSAHTLPDQAREALWAAEVAAAAEDAAVAAEVVAAAGAAVGEAAEAAAVAVGVAAAVEAKAQHGMEAVLVVMEVAVVLVAAAVAVAAVEVAWAVAAVVVSVAVAWVAVGWVAAASVAADWVVAAWVVVASVAAAEAVDVAATARVVLSSNGAALKAGELREFWTLRCLFLVVWKAISPFKIEPRKPLTWRRCK